MEKVGIHEARVQLSALVDRVAEGETVPPSSFEPLPRQHPVRTPW
jgi:hypothetical protein